jgi:hypothetical protein
MGEVSCPICEITIQSEEDGKEHLETHRLTDPNMQKIALHLIKLEERLIDLEKSKGYEGNENRQLPKGEEKAQQPKALTMAELLKDKESLKKKTKLGDGSNIVAEDR